jgi:hypothetical protein
MCNELIRAFPSAQNSCSSRLDAAKQALRNFHYVFDISDFEQTVVLLQDILEIPLSRRSIKIENETAGIDLVTNESYLRSLEELERAYDASISDDALLYESAEITRPSVVNGREPSSGYERWGNVLSTSQSEAMEIYLRHLGHYYRAELTLSGGLLETSRQIDTRMNWLSFLRQEINR